jgi:DNA-binding NtrC family response regulator
VLYEEAIPVVTMIPIIPKSVLVVEDEGMVRWLAVDFFTDAGFDCIEACNADEAMIALEDRNFHLLFTDVEMPGTMNGIKLANHVHASCPETHIIIASGRVSVNMKELPEGAMFFRKPYDFNRITDFINTLE